MTVTFRKHIKTEFKLHHQARGGWSWIFNLVSFVCGSDSHPPGGHMWMQVCVCIRTHFYGRTATQLSVVHFPFSARVIVFGVLSCYDAMHWGTSGRPTHVHEGENHKESHGHYWAFRQNVKKAYCILKVFICNGLCHAEFGGYIEIF